MEARALLLVLDSVGVGHAPDAALYGDEGTNTLAHLLDRCPDIQIPTLRTLGLEATLDLSSGRPAKPPATGTIGVLAEKSSGKDTTTGHWELAGVVLEQPFPTYSCFPSAWIDAIESEANVSFLGNIAASGTAILDTFGTEHLRTGKPILYTSADSVLQIAAHEEIIPPHQLYAICRIARKHAVGIGRVIARPFVGAPGGWKRTANRHDFSLTPPRTVLNALAEAHIPVTGIGKISDIFAGSGITSSHPTTSNAHGMQTISELWPMATGLLFANLVDFDMLFGHRRDVAGYARALEELDLWLAKFLHAVGPGDLVIITADHGNDPTWHGTDHTREQVPLLIPSPSPGTSLGVLHGFDHVAQLIAQHFAIDWKAAATSG